MTKTTKKRDPRWWRQFVSAVRLNAGDGELQDLVRFHEALDDGELAQRAALHVRQVLPYRFDGPRHRILELVAARRRGYGACGDATAAIAAALLMRGKSASVCYESTHTVPGYAHVRIVVDGVVADAYPDASLDVSRCSATLAVTRRSVSWPSAAASSPSDE